MMNPKQTNTRTNTPVDYEALANRVESASGHAALFLRLHSVGRKVGTRKTELRTVMDKLKARHAPVTRARAARILSLFSELGLGTMHSRSLHVFISWNPAVDVIKLGLCLAERAKQRRLLDEITTVSKGNMLVCMMPSGSFEALMATGLGKRLEVELLGKPKDPYNTPIAF